MLTHSFSEADPSIHVITDVVYPFETLEQLLAYTQARGRSAEPPEDLIP